MNKMKEVAEMLGVELGEEFYLKKGCFKYKLVKSGLLFKDGGWYDASITLVELLSGEKEIEWQPKKLDTVWAIYPHKKTPIQITFFENDLMFKRNMIFKTEKEALNRIKELGWIE